MWSVLEVHFACPLFPLKILLTSFVLMLFFNEINNYFIRLFLISAVDVVQQSKSELESATNSSDCRSVLECPRCTRIFKSRSGLQSHMRSSSKCGIDAAALHMTISKGMLTFNPCLLLFSIALSIKNFCVFAFILCFCP